MPQERWRLILLGSRLGEIAHPAPTHFAKGRANFRGGGTLTMAQDEPAASRLLPSVTVGDALRDLPRIAMGEGAEEVGYRLSNRVTNTHYRHISEAWSSLGDSERAYRKWLAYTMEDEYCVDLKNLAQTKRCEAKAQKVLKRRAHPRQVVFRSGR